MAAYQELYDLAGSEQALIRKVTVAVTIKANALSEIVPAPNASQIAWVREVYAGPRKVAEQIFYAVLAKNSGASVAQIQGATDAAVQTQVDAVVDSIFAV